MKKVFGFSLLEAMVAVAIIAILAAMALPSYLHKIIREQIEASTPLLDIAKAPISEKWRADHSFPVDNAEAGLPSPDKIVNNFVKSVAIENGTIHMTFGNRVHGALKGKVLSFRPAVINDAPIVPITWVCGNAEAPEKMTIKGTDRTTVAPQNLPTICRARTK